MSAPHESVERTAADRPAADHTAADRAAADHTAAGRKPSASPSTASPSTDLPTVDFGRRLLRLDTRRLGLLVPVRTLVACAVLVVVILVVGVASMTIGAYDLGLGAVLRAVFDPASDPAGAWDALSLGEDPTAAAPEEDDEDAVPREDPGSAHGGAPRSGPRQA